VHKDFTFYQLFYCIGIGFFEPNQKSIRKGRSQVSNFQSSQRKRFSLRKSPKRPVMICRLVAQHAIKEKIVDLQHQKRDLADSLLEGTDMSGKVSTDQLLQLISGN
jgi:hypothetical protein